MKIANILKGMETPKIFRKSGELLFRFFPKVKIDLIQSKDDTPPEEYLAKCAYYSIRIAFLVFVMFIFLGAINRNIVFYRYAFIFSPVTLIFNFFSMLYHPKVLAMKRAGGIDKELPFALRHLLIEIKSGIPLYQSLVAISEGYGAVSEEMSSILNKINGGKSEVDAIEESIVKCPSSSYRKAFWQVLNALKTGTNLEDSLQSSVDNIVREQLISIKKYGQELNPYSLMYMMVGIVIPSLGIAFLMLLSTFTGISFSRLTFYSILFVMVLFNLFFMNIVKTKRPLVKI